MNKILTPEGAATAPSRKPPNGVHPGPAEGLAQYYSAQIEELTALPERDEKALKRYIIDKLFDERVPEERKIGTQIRTHGSDTIRRVVEAENGRVLALRVPKDGPPALEFLNRGSMQAKMENFEINRVKYEDNIPTADFIPGDRITISTISGSTYTFEVQKRKNSEGLSVKLVNSNREGSHLVRAFLSAEEGIPIKNEELKIGTPLKFPQGATSAMTKITIEYLKPS